MAFLSGTHDPLLVSVSIGIAVLAGYTALDLTGRIRAAQGATAWGWLLAGALSMGSGIWAMHFVGMLAFDLPIEMGYRVDLTAASWLLAVLGSVLGLRLATAPTLHRHHHLSGTVFITTAIVGMHYTGMAAMDMRPAISYDPFWVCVSIGVALAASYGALRIAFSHSQSGFMDKTLAALALGGAVVGMHYTAMQAAQFPIGSVCGAVTAISTPWLAFLITNTALLLLACALVAGALDRRLQNRTAEHMAALERMSDQLRHANRHDSLTNLGNRVLLRERLNLAIEHAARTGSGFALIALDVDNFKQLNDNLGHDYGDDILRRVGAALYQSVRPQDTAVRMGSDEFSLIVVSNQGDEALEHVSERLLAAVRSVGAGRTRLSASLGLACYPADGKTAPALMKSADIALHNAKQAGRDRYAFFTFEQTAGLERDFVIRNELNAAIASGEIRPHYQPKYDVATRQLVGCEALARWHHPVRGKLSPGEFIMVAEQSNQINDLQMSMLRQICRDVRAWRDAGRVVPPIAFNLSAMCLRNTALPDILLGTLDEFGLSSDDLICEITETAAIAELAATLKTLRGLRACGIRIALDDFGTGLSSMSYLRDLPIDQLKIDRTFISQLTSPNEHGRMIVDAVINLAHAMNLEVVAEGVEEESQLVQLQQMHCDQVQGYLFSPALSADEFVRLTQRAPQTKVVPIKDHASAV